jgi:hypothetical protein
MTRNIIALFISSSLLSVSCYAQDSTGLLRTPYKLTIAVDKKTTYEENLNERPYVLPDRTLQLYPGETVFIEVDETDGVISHFRAVKEIIDSSKTLTISFTQIADHKVHQQMILKIQNPLPFKLVYKASIFLLKQKKWVETDVFPVMPKISGFETWQDIITSIGLGGWKLEK